MLSILIHHSSFRRKTSLCQILYIGRVMQGCGEGGGGEGGKHRVGRRGEAVF